MNILLITADSLRCDRTSLFDHQRDTTPFLSELADCGFEFRRAYANGRNTAASFPAIHTSTHESYYDGIGISDSGTPTVAEILQDEGYQTHGIHTNELISRDYNYNRGFDTYHDSRHSGDSRSGWRTRVQKLIGDGPVFSFASLLHRLSTKYLGIKIFNTADAVSGFENQIIEWATSTDGDWFIWAHYMNPHHPYEPPVECQRALGVDPVHRRTATRLSRKMRLQPEEITEEERKILCGLYDASVLSWDREVASTCRRLREVDEFDDTLIIITADHGELLGENGVYGHPSVLNQELLRVPLVFYGGPIKSGETNTQVGLIDLAPTVATLIGAEVPDEYRGRSLYKSQQGFRRFQDTTSPVQFCETGDLDSPLVAGVDGSRKMIHDRSTNEWREYALSEAALHEDLIERVDDDLKTAIHNHELSRNSSCKDGAAINQEQLQQDLQALGYME